jgi:hypothetical protein
LKGLQNIWGKDRNSQIQYLNILLGDVRGIPAEAMLPYDAVFVPNNDYLHLYLGNDVLNPEYELYDLDGKCLWNNWIIIPVKTVSGNCCGWVGFNPFIKANAENTKDYSISYYSHPSRDTMQRGKCLLVRPDIYKSAVSEGYICIVDGVFDAIHLDYCGFYSASLFGSELNQYNMFLLSFVKDVYIICDNDEAGVRLLKDFKRIRPDVHEVVQGRTKDIDLLLRSDSSSDFCRELRSAIVERKDLYYGG